MRLLIWSCSKSSNLLLIDDQYPYLTMHLMKIRLSNLCLLMEQVQQVLEQDENWYHTLCV